MNWGIFKDKSNLDSNLHPNKSMEAYQIRYKIKSSRSRWMSHVAIVEDGERLLAFCPSAELPIAVESVWKDNAKNELIKVFLKRKKGVSVGEFNLPKNPFDVQKMDATGDLTIMRVW
mgnify:CR=1 FL=1